MKCWECEIETEDIHHHHPVPRVRGGTKTIPLCESCHGKAHHRRKNMSTSALTKEGLAAKKERSALDGSWAGGHPPAGFTVNGDGFLCPNDDYPLIVKAGALRLDGLSIRKTAAALGISNHSKVQRWTNYWVDNPEELLSYKDS